MKTKLHFLVFSIILLSLAPIKAQTIELYSQFNGRYDFVFVGNTMNLAENGTGAACVINSISSATLTLNASSTIEKAYLYWAGSGNGDFEVNLNGTALTASRTFGLTQATSGLPFFSAFVEVTNLVQTTGNGLYTLADLDVSDVLTPSAYCNNGTNFAGWALVIVYSDSSLPLNQLNVYDGLDYVPTDISITLNNLNVIDNQNAAIGFVAWEGDRGLAVNESLKINNILIGNPPLNPNTNAFNGTNSFTGATDLYNMDLDVYPIQNTIQIGDTSAQIQLSSGQDFVMINTIVTKFNSQLPDATITIDRALMECNSPNFRVNYAVHNNNCTDPLPAGVPIAIYLNGVYWQSASTQTVIPIDGSETGSIALTLPTGIPSPFDLKFVVDDDGTGVSQVIELNETNNSAQTTLSLETAAVLPQLNSLQACNEGFSQGTFSLASTATQLQQAGTNTVVFYPSQTDWIAQTNAISNLANYTAVAPATLYAEVSNGRCYQTAPIEIIIKNCPPRVYNYVSANNDTYNDSFSVDYLRNIFLQYTIDIYNRWGTKVWTGSANTADWDGTSNTNIVIGSTNLPDGTYFYVIDLNDSDNPQPLTGFVYLTH
ncbi:MAG: gliding motility-associated C-terminal domain-containing protein [Flavobacterium sp.]|nr:gliding motility-associated C-terminal domain-containing protein [Flavobacterium sp.]